MAPDSKPASRTRLILAVVIIVIIVSLLIAVIVLAVQKSDLERDAESNKQQAPAPQKMPVDLLSYLKLADGLDVTWFPWIQNVGDINKARADNTNILDVKVVPGDSPMVQGGALSLSRLLDDVRDDDSVMNFYPSTGGVAETVVGELRARGWGRPVLLSVPVLSDSQQDFNLTEFLQTLDGAALTTPYGVNLDLTSACCDEPLGLGLLEYVASVASDADFLVTVEIDAAVLASSWTHLRWLLAQADNIRLVISAGSGPGSWNTDVMYDLVMVRGDADERRIFYNLGKTQRDAFLPLASTAGSPLVYFNVVPRDAGSVIWSHNTDTWELINYATTGATQMVEGDIRLEPVTKVPIMAHDLGDNNNLTFAQWLEEIIKVDKGMKLDFKELQAVGPALTIVNSRVGAIKGPIWANADILSGPGDKPVTIPADKFLQAVQSFPGVTLSLGWTTIRKGADSSLNYTMAHVREMDDVCKGLPQPVTFPIRAEQALDSWTSFDWLLGQSRRYSITVWTAPSDNVTKADMDAFKRKFEMSRIYFDLPEELMPTIL